MLAAGLLPFHVWFVVYSILDSYERSQLSEIGFKYTWSMSELNHAILNICLFPPLFFFYGLYYTDVWSVLSVLTTIQFYQRKWKRLTIVAGIVSFFFRQTNVFWVSIYLGGSEVMRTLRRGRSGVEYPTTASIVDVMAASWQHSCVYDPLISQASFEGMLPAMHCGLPH